ncbi:MAG: 6,7-dimethyl-8-ribityllumazine synthase, partial [Cytophagales bacterium]
MAGILKSVSKKSKLNLSKTKFAIVVAEWNDDITEPLFQGAYQALLALGAKKSNIIRKNVPGSFELPLAAQWMAARKDMDAI